jgi:uncharacterized protein (DUF169 family)
MKVRNYSGYLLIIPGAILLIYHAYLYLSGRPTEGWMAGAGLFLCASGVVLNKKLKKSSE